LQSTGGGVHATSVVSQGLAAAERMAILELKAARNLSAAQTAGMFLVGQPTIASWMKRFNEAGPDALIRMPRNVNKFPEFVKYIVCRLKMTVSFADKYKRLPIVQLREVA